MSTEKRTTYSPAFKEEAIRLYLEGGRSYRQVCEELGIKDKRSLRTWGAKMQRGDSLGDGRGEHEGSRRGRARTKFESLEEKLAYVEAERDYLKKLYRSRFGHEWGAHKEGNSLLLSANCVPAIHFRYCTMPGCPRPGITNGKEPCTTPS